MFENIIAIIFIIILILGILANFYIVDKPRTPVRFNAAVIGAILNVGLIILLWKAYL